MRTYWNFFPPEVNLETRDISLNLESREVAQGQFILEEIDKEDEIGFGDEIFVHFIFISFLIDFGTFGGKIVLRYWYISQNISKEK